MPCAARSSSSSVTRHSTPATSSRRPTRSSRCSAAISSAAWRAGPIRRDSTFFFLDYQGQRQTIGRTVISTVPTTLQRQGVFTESIGGRVPAIYDPATTMPAGSGVTRTPFPGGVIPMERIDPVARTLLERYPLPTSCRNRQQLSAHGRRGRRSGSVQPAHRSAGHEPRPAVRAPDAIPRGVHPGDAPARRQRRDDRNARAAGHHVVVLRLVLPARLLRFAAERAARRRHAACRRPCRRHAAGRRPPTRWDCRAFRLPRSFPTRCRRS